MSLRDLENELIAPKHWSLVGESSGKKRTRDALLDEALEAERVDTSSTVALGDNRLDDEEDEAARTEAQGRVSDSLERIIKQRVCQGLFDNVAYLDKKATKPEKTAEDLASDLIDTTAPKGGLTELYAINAFKGTNATTGVEKTEARCLELWRALSRNLDQLCDSCFVPKPTPVRKIDT